MSRTGSSHRINIGQTGTRMGGTLRVKPGDPAYHTMTTMGLRRKEHAVLDFLAAKVSELKGGGKTAHVANLNPADDFDKRILFVLRRNAQDLKIDMDCEMLVCDGECPDCGSKPMYVIGRNIHGVNMSGRLCKNIREKVDAALAMPSR